jgi:hypothetical protein
MRMIYADWVLRLCRPVPVDRFEAMIVRPAEESLKRGAPEAGATSESLGAALEEREVGDDGIRGRQQG